MWLCMCRSRGLPRGTQSGVSPGLTWPRSLPAWPPPPESACTQPGPGGGKFWGQVCEYGGEQVSSGAWCLRVRAAYLCGGVGARIVLAGWMRAQAVCRPPRLCKADAYCASPQPGPAPIPGTRSKRARAARVLVSVAARRAPSARRSPPPSPARSPRASAGRRARPRRPRMQRARIPAR